jgi:hypothetical protein
MPLRKLRRLEAAPLLLRADTLESEADSGSGDILSLPGARSLALRINNGIDNQKIGFSQNYIYFTHF